MKKTTLQVIFVLGLVLLVAGGALIYLVNRPYGTGLMCLGAMCTTISFGQIKAAKETKP
jgi:hypothetical protein